jgi:hypothetical protein
MKQIITFALLVFTCSLFGQDPSVDKGAGWIYFSDIPSLVVDPTTGAETAININGPMGDPVAYIWNRSGTAWERWYKFDQGSGAPTIHGATSMNAYLDADSGLWYNWNGSAWVLNEAWDQEEIEDLVGAMFAGGSHSGVNINYDDNGASPGVINVIVTGGGGGSTVDSLIELGDVALTSPVDSALFIYDAGLGKWRDDVSLSDVLATLSGLSSVSSDATLSGDGTGGDPLGIAQQGATSGQPLKWSGSAWLPDDDLVYDGDSSITNELQYLTLTNIGTDRQIVIGTLSTPTDTITLDVDDGDSDATNELITAFGRTGDSVYVTDAAGTYYADLSDLSPAGIFTDTSATNELQDVDLWNLNGATGLEISLTQDATTHTISLASLEETAEIADTAAAIRADIPVNISDLGDVNTSGANTDDILRFNGTNWYADTESGAGSTAVLSFSSPILSIVGSNSVDLSALDTQLTDEEVEDIIGLMVSGNSTSGINVNYDDVNGKLDFIVTGGGGDSSVDSLSEQGDVAITSPVDSAILIWDDGLGKWRDDISLSELLGGGGSGTDDQQVTNFSISANTLTLEVEDDGQAPHTVDLSPYLDNTDSQTLSYNAAADQITISGGNTIDITEVDTQLSQEEVEDIVGAMIGTTSGITVTYDAVDNEIDYSVAGGGITDFKTTVYGDSILIDTDTVAHIHIPPYDRANMQQWFTAVADTANNRVKNIIFYGDSNTEYFPWAFTIPLRDHLTATLGNAGYGWINGRTDRQDHIDLNDTGDWFAPASAAYGEFALDLFDKRWDAADGDGLEVEFSPSTLLAGADAAKPSAQCSRVEFHYYGYDNTTTVSYSITNPTSATTTDTFTVSEGYNVQIVDLPEFGYHDATFTMVSGDSIRYMGMNFTTPDTANRQGVIVHRIGHSGASWGDFHQIPDTLFQQQIENLEADLIIFQLGGNGFTQSEADSLINKVRVWSDTVGIALLTPQVNTANNQAAGKQQDRAYWYLSRKYDAGFASLFQLHGDRVIGDSLDIYESVGSAHFNFAGGRINGKFIGQDLLGIDRKTSYIEAGTNVTLTGQGTEIDPYVIASTATGGGGGSGMAIDSTVTNGDQGAVLFIDDNGALQQDTSNLYWDHVNNKLGIGTGSDIAGKFQVIGNIGSDIGNEATLFGINNATNATALERMFAAGKGNFDTTTGSLNYSFVAGWDNAGSATGNHLYDNITGLRNMQNASSSTSTLIMGLENFQASTGAIQWSFASGQDNFNTSTGGHTYNIAIGNENFLNADGSYLIGFGNDNFRSLSGTAAWCIGIGQDAFRSLSSAGNSNIGLGLEPFEDITSGQGNIGIGFRPLEGATDLSIDYAISIGYEAGENHTGTELSESIFIGYEAGNADSESNTVVIGSQANATADNQIMLGDATGGYTELRSRNYGFNIDQSLTGLDGHVLAYNETNDQFEAQAVAGDGNGLVDDLPAGSVSIDANGNNLQFTDIGLLEATFGNGTVNDASSINFDEDGFTFTMDRVTDNSWSFDENGLHANGNEWDGVSVLNFDDTDSDATAWAMFEDSSGDFVIQDSDAGTDLFKIDGNGTVSLGGTIPTDNTEVNILVLDGTTVSKRNVTTAPFSFLPTGSQTSTYIQVHGTGLTPLKKGNPHTLKVTTIDESGGGATGHFDPVAGGVVCFFDGRAMVTVNTTFDIGEDDKEIEYFVRVKKNDKAVQEEYFFGPFIAGKSEMQFSQQTVTFPVKDTDLISVEVEYNSKKNARVVLDESRTKVLIDRYE